MSESLDPLTVDELAEILHLSPRTVARKAREGVWPHTRPAKAIMFTQKHVAQILAMGEMPARPARRRAS